jgi:antirestriction protein ArdC
MDMSSAIYHFDPVIQQIERRLHAGKLPWQSGWSDKPGAIGKEGFSSIDSCESIVRNMPHPPSFKTGSNLALYQRETDTVYMPDQSMFQSNFSFYGTLFHEMAHSTAHNSRLNRPAIPGDNSIFSKKDKAKEEIIAECTAACLGMVAGTLPHTIDNHAAFIQSWLNLLLNDGYLFKQLAEKAKLAAAYILHI